MSRVAITDDNIQKFFVEEDPDISDECKAIFTTYSAISETELVAHIRRLVSFPDFLDEARASLIINNPYALLLS